MSYFTTKTRSSFSHTGSACRKACCDKTGDDRYCHESPEYPDDRSVGKVIMVVLFLMIVCLSVNCESKGDGKPSEVSMPGRSCAQHCPLGPGENETGENGAADRLLQQFFCPIVELPALHGLLAPQQ